MNIARKIREAAKAGEQEATKEAHVASLRFDLSVFKERIERYPTDNRMKFEYSVRKRISEPWIESVPTTFWMVQLSMLTR